MIEQKIYLSKYKWEILVLYNTNINNVKYVIDKLKNICTDYKNLNLAYNNIVSGKINSGFIYSNMDERKSLITIGEHNSKDEFINTVVHEANHLQSHIATYYNLDEKSEEVSYLIGEIVKSMFFIFKKIIC